MTRLAINGLQNGSQPFWTRDRRYALVANGEIYNSEALWRRYGGQHLMVGSDSDCAVLLPLMLQDPALLREVEGMFAFAMWDSLLERLTLGRDPMGEKPLYICDSDNGIAFSSEFSALASIASTRSLVPEAIHDFLVFGFVLPGTSLVDEIDEVPAGTTLTISVDGSKSLNPYWNWSEQLMRAIDDYPVINMKEQISETIRSSLASDVPLSVALSGGIDSSAILAVASENSKQPVTAITMTYDTRSAGDERLMAMATSHRMRVPIVLRHLTSAEVVQQFPRMVSDADYPNADPALPCYWALCDEVSTHGGKVILFGHGGDEIHWGYEWVREAAAQGAHGVYDLKANLPLTGDAWKRLPELRGHRNARLHALVAKARRVSGKASTYGGLTTSLDNPQWLYEYSPTWGEARHLPTSPSFLDALNESSKLSPRRDLGLGNSDGRLDKTSLSHVNALLTIAKSYLAGNGLTQLDRIAMSRGVEPRVPLASPHLVLASIVSYLRGGNTPSRPKEALRNVLETRRLQDVTRLPKRGFTPPVHLWRRRLMKAYGHELTDGQILRLGLASQEDLTYLVNHPRATISYRFLCLELWLRNQARLGGMQWTI